MPRHLEIKAIELKPNENGDWIEETVVFDNRIENTINQSSPEAYNISGTAREISTELPIDEVDLIFLKKWFNNENANAIMDAIDESGGSINL